MLLFAAALLLVQPMPQQQCAAMDVNLPAALAGWTREGEILMPGLALVMPTSPNPGAGRAGRVADTAFEITTAGTYGIALDQPGWIDVIPEQEDRQTIESERDPLKSSSHGHGPDCSTIRKIVRFDLLPGWYRLSLTGLAKPQVKAMLITP